MCPFFPMTISSIKSKILSAMFMKVLIFTFLIYQISYGAEVCSRVARINFQEVLVDAGNGKKGEGLRYYLQKDPDAKRYLDIYQKKTTPSIWNAATSTVGSLFIIAGLIQTGNSKSQKDQLIFGGSAIIGLNYLINQALNRKNETYLQKSIELYNKKNSPKIYFTPVIDSQNNIGASAGISREF